MTAPAWTRVHDGITYAVREHCGRVEWRGAWGAWQASLYPLADTIRWVDARIAGLEP